MAGATTHIRVSTSLATRLRFLAAVERTSIADLLERLLADRLPTKMQIDVVGDGAVLVRAAQHDE